MAEKDKSNIRALVEFRLAGRKVKAGEVVAKTEFPNKSDWQNLVNMTPPRAEETGTAVGKSSKLPGA